MFMKMIVIYSLFTKITREKVFSNYSTMDWFCM